MEHYFEPLENDVTLSLVDYSNPTITPDMEKSAASNQINSYAFGGTDLFSLCQHIYQNKAVLLLIKVDNGYWGTTTPTFTTPTYGHFVVAYGYTPNSIKIICSADRDFPLKEIGKQYINSSFIREAGTAIDLPPQEVQKIIDTSTNVASQIVAAPIPTPIPMTSAWDRSTFRHGAQSPRNSGLTFTPTTETSP